MNTKLNKTYQFIFWGLIFLFLGLTTSPTVVGGYHIVILIPTLFLFMKGERISFSKSSLFLIALFTWGLITTFYNFDTIIKPGKAFQDLKYYAFGVFCILTLKFFFHNAPIKHQKILLKILLFTIIAGFFVGLSKAWFGFDIVKWRTGEFHPRSGGFNNYMRYGYSSAFFLLLGIGAFFNYKKIESIISKRWLSIFLLFNTFAIMAAQTRGAVLGLLIGIPFLLLKYKPKFGKALFLLGFLGIISIGIYSVSKKSSNRYFNINDDSNNVRMSQFFSAYKSIQEKPIFGLGADQFSYNVKAIKERHNIWAKDYSGHAHNIILEHAANYGIPGAILFIGFIFFWFLEMIKSKTDLGWVVASYILAFFAAGQVELLFDVINSHLIFFIYSYSQFKLLQQKSI